MKKKIIVYNIKGKRSYEHESQVEIIMQHQNYMMWVQSIVPCWKADYMRKKKNKLLIFNHKLRGLFEDSIEDIKAQLDEAGFAINETNGLEWLIRYYGQPGYYSGNNLLD